MAEADRKLSRQRVLCPTDSSLYVDIPVIDGMGWGCTSEQAQGYQWTFDNSANNQNRKVHTRRVENPTDASQYVEVERIENITGKIMASQAQEYVWDFSNFDPPPSTPQTIGQDPQHFKVHYVRYYQDNDTSKETYIDVELIDECKIKCMAEQAQEYIFYLKNPPLGELASQSSNTDPYNPTIAICDLQLPLLDGQAPWRFDPFQNIVNVHWESPIPSTGEEGWIIWIVPNTFFEDWGWAWGELVGGVNYGTYPYFGMEPFHDFDAGAATITWEQYHSLLWIAGTGQTDWEDILPELIPIRIDWLLTGKQLRPAFQVTISDSTA